MNPEPFIIAAYAVSVGSTAALLAASWRAMRRAEKRAEAMKR